MPLRTLIAWNTVVGSFAPFVRSSPATAIEADAADGPDAAAVVGPR